MSHEGAVLDLDGTVYRGETALPGAPEAIERFRSADIRTLFFSNNPTRSREDYAAKLRDLGIDAAPEAVLSAGTVTARFLADEHGDERVFLIGEEGLAAQLEAAGIALVDDPTEADVLVVSWTRAFDYDDMRAGYRALAAGATFYGSDPDRLVPAADGLVPGSGSMINAVGGIVDREPRRVLGKPSPEAQRAALAALGCPADRCFVVGDRLETDIALGERADMTTVLVRTGVTTDADLEESDVRPDHVVDSIAAVPELLGIGE
jgi:4-nitrophenyl phosphatase